MSHRKQEVNHVWARSFQMTWITLSGRPWVFDAECNEGVLDNPRIESSYCYIMIYLLCVRSFNPISGKAQALLDCLGKEFADPKRDDVGMCFVNEASLCHVVLAGVSCGLHETLAYAHTPPCFNLSEACYVASPSLEGNCLV